MAAIVRTYPIPFLDRLTLPVSWLRSLPPHLRAASPWLSNLPEHGTLEWDYARHGRLPWMQSFYDWRFADLDGDGELEWLQTNGARHQSAHCLDGGTLWAYDDPQAGFSDLRFDSAFPALDLLRDGAPRLVCGRMQHGVLHLSQVDARSGALICSTPYPDWQAGVDNGRSAIQVVHLTGGKFPQGLLVSWDGRSLHAYDPHLKPLWHYRPAPGAAPAHSAGFAHSAACALTHTPFAWEIDGDGYDEFLTGAGLLDHDGRLLWQPDLPAAAASVRLLPLDDGDVYTAAPRLLFSAGPTCYDIHGQRLWQRTDVPHAALLQVGKLRADLPGKQIVVYDAAGQHDPTQPDRVLALDKDGQVLWQYATQAPLIQPGSWGCWLGDWTGDGLQEVFVNGPDACHILDGHGQVLESLPGHLIYVFDLLGDRRVEAVLLSDIGPGMELRLATNDARNPHPATNAVLHHRRTSTAMYNASRY